MQHLGLDLGATNLKWAMLSQLDGDVDDGRPRPGPHADRG